MWAIRRYRSLPKSTHFIVKTDSNALTWLQRSKNSKAKLLRWALLLQEFDFELIHCPSKENELPDGLSRNPDEEDAIDEEDWDRLVAPGVARFLQSRAS